MPIAQKGNIRKIETMNQIQYYKHRNGMSWGAVAPGQFEESIIVWENGQFGDARIDLVKNSRVTTSFYEQSDSGYSPCSREDYLKARHAAQVATAEFFGEFQPFQASPVRVNTSLMQGFVAQVHKPGPLVTLATGAVIINDLPF